MNEEYKITDSSARVILDSRGNATVEATVRIGDVCGTCGAPSGASTGATEVIPFRNGSARETVEIFYSKVKQRILGFNAFNQNGFDDLLREIDGSENFSEIGGNLSTALSIACAKAVSRKLDIPLYRYVGGNFRAKLPKPLGNVIGGGKHAINGTTIQEFLVSNNADSFLKAIMVNAKIHKRVGKLLTEKLGGQSIGVGDERAWVASISDEDAMDILKKACNEVSSEESVNVVMGSDLAASNFYDGSSYVYRDHKFSRDQQIDFVKLMVKEKGFTIIEDPMEENDFDGHSLITSSVGSRAMVIGDDIYTTNSRRIERGIELHSTNAVLIKVNQIGTLTETWKAVKTATRASMKNVISHRSGETNDDFIAHLSIAFSSSYIKTGTIGGERLAKLNELVRIEEDLKL
ncbi:MAG: phosphopyruvate hydratase [Thermoplasmataceae archaeon]